MSRSSRYHPSLGVPMTDQIANANIQDFLPNRDINFNINNINTNTNTNMTNVRPKSASHGKRPASASAGRGYRGNNVKNVIEAQNNIFTKPIDTENDFFRGLTRYVYIYVCICILIF